MNTSKQVNAMIGLLFLLVISVALYWLWDPIRADSATDKAERTAAERGANLFATYCRTCHGNQGMGRLERSDLPGLPLNVPDNRPDNPLALETLQARLRDTIHCGRVGTLMPAWSQEQGGPFNDEQIRQLVTLITSSKGEFIDPETGQETTEAWKEALEIADHGHGTNPGDRTGKHVAADVSASTTVIPLTDVSNLPFQGNDKLRIENEVVRITGVDANNKTITVERGILSTDAVEHAQGAEVFAPPQDPPTGPINSNSCGQIARSTPSTSATPSAPVSPDASGNLAVQMQDNVFTQNNIHVQAGQTVNVNLTNTGSSIHNMRIAGPDGNYETNDDVVSNPDNVRAGATATLSFVFAQAGSTKFQCDFHPNEMTGTITVQ